MVPLAPGVLVPWGFDMPPAVGAALMSLSIIVAVNAQLLRRLDLEIDAECPRNRDHRATVVHREYRVAQVQAMGELLPKKKPSARKPVDKLKQAEKRARRDERKLADARASKLADRKRRVRTGLMVLVGVAVIGTAGFFIIQKASPPELPGVAKQPYDGRSHAAEGQPVDYGTATPTSGTHSARSPRCGILDQHLPLEFAVHALEHGVVVVWYQPTLTDEVVSGLRAIVNRFDERVILSSNAGLTDPVVATAWLRLKAYDGADPEIEQFIETYRNRGPESFGCAY